MKIDTNLNEVTKTINTVYNHFDNKWNSDLKDRDIINMLEEAEYCIKDAKELLNN